MICFRSPEARLPSSFPLRVILPGIYNFSKLTNFSFLSQRIMYNHTKLLPLYKNALEIEI